MNDESFRQAAYEAIDRLISYRQSLATHSLGQSTHSFSVQSHVTPGYLKEALPLHAPEQGQSITDIVRDIEQHILPGITHWQSPSFFAYYPANFSYAALLGDLYCSMFNVIGFNWVASPACTELETIVMDWLAQLLGLPECYHSTSHQGAGVIQGTASEAIMTCLVAARHELLSKSPEFEGKEMVAYCSSQAHSAVMKACQILRVQCRTVKPTSADSESIDGDALNKLIVDDLQHDRVPFFVCATVGTTGTCAVDDVESMGRICKNHQLWLHVDAAYAGSACICPELRPSLMKGIEWTDSWCFNPHKWLLTNFDCSALWIRERQSLIDALSITPPFLRNVASDSGQVIDYRDWQIPLGRRFRSLKLWFVLRIHGAEGLRQHIREHCRLAARFASFVKSQSNMQLTCEPRLSLVVFHSPPLYEMDIAGAKLDRHRRWLERINATGQLFMIHTASHATGKSVLRFAIGSPLTTEKHVDEACRIIKECLDAELNEIN